MTHGFTSGCGVIGSADLLRRLLWVGITFLVLCISTFTLAGPTLAGPKAAKVRICDDASEWPPFTYYKVENGHRSAQVHGFSVDIIREILSQRGIEFQLDLHPWRRCLREVEMGGRYQMLLSASDNAERRSRFLFSEPYYQTHPYYFYSKKQFPDGLPIQSVRDLRAYAIGGISGYNYDYLGVTAAEVNTESIDYRHLILKLYHNRVDVFVEQIEVLEGFRLVGRDFLDDPDLGYAPLPGTGPTQFHMMFTDNEEGRALRDLVNEGLQQLKASGRIEALRRKHLIGQGR